VRVFFDECVPQPLRKLLGGHQISTAQEMGWGRLRNGELIRRAEAADFAVAGGFGVGGWLPSDSIDHAPLADKVGATSSEGVETLAYSTS
jgi:hypothetical protein